MSDAITMPLETTESSPRPARRRGRRGGLLRTTCDVVLKGTLLFLAVQTWFIQGYRVYGSCMEPNLRTGERVLGSKLPAASGIRRGDVVVFQPPHRPDTAFVKRVIGLPGDVLQIRDSRVYVNGRPLDEPYLRLSWHDDQPPQRIRDNMVYVMGDNRDDSSDSRAWGELPLSSIQARAWVRYWPLERAGLIR